MTKGKKGGRRGRRLSLSLLVLALAVFTWSAFSGFPYFKAFLYEQRIRETGNVEGNLRRLAEMRHPAALAYLERYALGTTESEGDYDAGRLVYEYYPESEFARGMRDYEQSVGHAYFSYYGRYRELSQRERVARLRSWLDRYPLHPGRDDACLRLAKALCDTAPIEALDLLHEGFHARDGDKRNEITNLFQRVLECYASADQLVRWLDSECPNEIESNVSYVAAVKRMRQRRFRAALELFVRSRGTRRDAPIMPGPWVPRPFDHLNALIDEQVEACRWFAVKEQELELLDDKDARAALLHEMGRRCFRREKDFYNHFYRVYLCVQGRRPDSLNDIALGNHYRQAAEFFRRIVREHPSYRDIEKVEYSIPLCIWRVRGDWTFSGGELDGAIYKGFQAFAEKYPESSMADEALYVAGIHHWLASRRADDSVIRANMARVATSHLDGNVVWEYGDVSWELWRALREHHAKVLGRQAEVLSEQLRGWAESAERGSRRPREELAGVGRQVRETLRPVFALLSR